MSSQWSEKLHSCNNTIFRRKKNINRLCLKNKIQLLKLLIFSQKYISDAKTAVLKNAWN